jgi:hypothetical protein
MELHFVIITYGMGVHWSLKAARDFEGRITYTGFKDHWFHWMKN